MLSLTDLVAYLNPYLDPDHLADYCPNGLQIEGKLKIERLATGVSASLDTIEKAVELGIDALIVHHGLFWKGDSFCITGAKQKKISRLLENKISLLAYHLPLDAHRELGNNWKAANDLKWENLQPFGVLNGSYIGVKGTFSPLSKKVFQTSLEKYYNKQAIIASGGKEEVSSAALVSGGAYRECANAAAEGVDCFITGNFDEPAWGIAHEEKINFYALGHTATERVGVQALAAHLRERFKISTSFIDTDNPF